MNSTLRGLLVVSAAIAIDLLFWDADVTLADGAALPLWLPPAVTVFVHQSLWWRRRSPVLVFAVQWSFALVSLVVPLWQPFAGLLVATFAIAAATPRRVAMIALAVLPAPFLAHSLGQARDSLVPLQTLLVLTALWLGLAVTTWAAGRHVRRQAQRLSRWQQHQDQLRQEETLQERLALARELHDGVANTITAVLIQAAAARTTGNNESLAAVEATARRAMDEIQSALRLMPRAGVAAPDGPRLDELPDLFALARAAGLDLRPATIGMPRPLPKDTEVAAYRAIQEGITNVLKYAPSGSLCRVTMAWTDAELVVSVVDEPDLRTTRHAARPTLPATSGRGLAGLQDRIRPLGGWVECGSTGPGFRLAAGLPVTVRA